MRKNNLNLYGLSNNLAVISDIGDFQCKSDINTSKRQIKNNNSRPNLIQWMHTAIWWSLTKTLKQFLRIVVYCRVYEKKSIESNPFFTLNVDLGEMSFHVTNVQTSDRLLKKEAVVTFWEVCGNAVKLYWGHKVLCLSLSATVNKWPKGYDRGDPTVPHYFFCTWHHSPPGTFRYKDNIFAF